MLLFYNVTYLKELCYNASAEYFSGIEKLRGSKMDDGVQENVPRSARKNLTRPLRGAKFILT